MEENADGSAQFVRVVLKPAVKVAAGSDRAKASSLHEKAHRLCFIARSVNFSVEVSPQVEEQPL
jgi:organic hydroperoxide reductase OsmC/OhrA